MKSFLQEVSENLDKFYWTENNALHLMESRMGAQGSDSVVFKITDSRQCIIEVVVYDGDCHQRIADKHYSLDSSEGKLINKIYIDSRVHIIQSNKREETKLLNKYHELVENSERIIRKHFN